MYHLLRFKITEEAIENHIRIVAQGDQSGQSIQLDISDNARKLLELLPKVPQSNTENTENTENTFMSKDSIMEILEGQQ